MQNSLTILRQRRNLYVENNVQNDSAPAGQPSIKSVSLHRRKNRHSLYLLTGRYEFYLRFAFSISHLITHNS